MTEDMIVQMYDHQQSDLDDRIKLALDLAEDFILNHARGVDDALMERLKAHFSEEQIVELTIAIGIWDSVHKFNNVFDIDPPVTGELFETGVPDVPEDMLPFVTDPGNKY
ncbi:MAG: carboxymuconolactone decarboxylase family protein [Pseudomonadales bacterium]